MKGHACRVLLALCAVQVASPILAQEQQTREFELNISSQPLRALLNDLSRQTGLQVLLTTSGHEDVIVGPFRGKYDLDAVFDQILKNTGLTYRRVNEHTIAVTAKRVEISRLRWNDDEAGRAFLRLNDQKYLPATGGGFNTAGAAGTSSGPMGDETASVIVTGTRIRGAAPVGAEVRVYSRQEIAQTGAGSVGDFARYMTSNFSGTDVIANSSSNTRLATGGTGATSPNTYNGTAFNLRGLGPLATLTLLNGHRMAPGGGDGSFVDVSSIPLSVIERIEVLSDGASAIYGADAVGGVVNIITRKDFDGAESQVRYGESTEGGAAELSASQFLGTSWDSGNVFVNYTYSENDGLDASQRDYIGEQGGPFSLAPAEKRNSAFVSARQSFSDSTSILLDAMYSKGDYSSRLTTDVPLQFSSTATSGSREQGGATLSLDHSFNKNLRAVLTGNYSKMEQQSDGIEHVSIASIGYESNGTISTVADAEEYSADALLDATLFSLPAGSVRAAFGGSYRAEEFATANSLTTDGITTTNAVPTAQRHTISAFTELAVPIVSSANAFPLVGRLDISAAIRYDDSSDFEAATSPRVGVSWSPVAGLRFHGTYGESYRAPLLVQLSSLNAFYTISAFNEQTQEVVNTLMLAGGSSSLKPETAITRSVGFELRPASVSGLSLAADYFTIDYKDRILTPPFTNFSEIFGPTLTPFMNLQPSLAEIQGYFDSPGFLADFAGGGPEGVGAIFDQRFANITSTEQSGVDARITYDFALPQGNLSLSLSGTRLFDYDLKTTPTSPDVSLVSTFGRPVKGRGRASVAWSREALSAAISINYVGGYTNPLVVPQQGIDSWTTGDVYVSYEVGQSASARVLSGVRIALGINNVTDEEPPYVEVPPALPEQNPLPFDPTNASPLGRFISFQMTKTW